MFNTLGQNTKTTILVMESHKLSIEFTASAAINVGNPVKLGADGRIAPLAAGDDARLRIGYAYNSGVAGDLVTVFVRGYHLQFGITTGAAATGLATFQGYDGVTAVGGLTGYNTYAAATGPTDVAATGFILDVAAAAGTLVRVLLF